MLVAIMSTWAESETEYIKERMESGRDFAVNNRGGNIRRVPLGYKSVDRRLEIYEPEAEIVAFQKKADAYRTMFERYGMV